MQHRISTVDQIGLLLQSARKAGHFTQAQLAAQMGLSQSRLSKMEQSPGSATVQQLLSMCSVLGIDLVMQRRFGEVSAPTALIDAAACKMD